MKTTRLTAFCYGALMLLVLLAGGCKVEKVAAPQGQGSQPASVQVTLGASSIANGGNTTVTVRVTDASGFVVSNANVALSVIASTAGTFNPAAGTTDQSGLLTSTFTAAAAGNNSTVTIRAAVTVGSGSISGSASLTIGTPPVTPTSVVVTLSTYTINPGPGTTTVTATVTGSGSTPVSGATVTFSVSDATAGSFSGGVSTITATTNASGVASVTFNANNVNTMVQILATAGTLSNSATLTIGVPLPPTAATMNLSTSPAQVAIQAQSTISVSLLSSSGAPVFSTPVTISITAGQTLGSLSTSPSVTTVSVTTNSAGTATATFYAGTSSGIVTITATSGSLSKQVSILITSDPASISLTITNDILKNGETTNITAKVLNAANQPVTVGTTVTFEMTYSGSLAPGALSSTTGFTVTSGDAAITFTADQVNTGPVFIKATAGTVSTPLYIIQVNPASAGSLLFVSADPQLIGLTGSGVSTSKVTFQVLNTAGGPLANQSVDFSIVTGPPGATLTTSSGSTDSDGYVSIYLQAGTVPGAVNIVAKTTVSTLPLVQLSTAASAVAIGGGVPSYEYFSLSVERFNVPGWSCDNVTSMVNVNVADRFGNYNILEGSTVNFVTRYGAVNAYNLTNAKGQTGSEFRSQDPRPTDGHLRVLVYAAGEERFIDMNADGLYTAGTDSLPPAGDLDEPFIDADNDGAHQSTEMWINWPSTVTGATTGYDQKNGVWDSSTWIWKWVDLWLTGPPSTLGPDPSRIECCDPVGLPACTLITGDFTLAKGSSTYCYVYSADVNGNALSAGTKVSLTSDQTAAKITWIEGYETLPDARVSGPAETGYKVTNNTSATAAVDATLSTTIKWLAPGTGCAGAELVIPYSGKVTLSP